MTPSYDPRYLKFFDLFNREEFFEAHEVLESLWLETKTEERDFYQGLIQLAAAFVHIQKGTPEGAKNLYEKASKRLLKYPEPFFGISILKALKSVRETIDSPKPFPHLIPPAISV